MDAFVHRSGVRKETSKLVPISREESPAKRVKVGPKGDTCPVRHARHMQKDFPRVSSDEDVRASTSTSLIHDYDPLWETGDEHDQVPAIENSLPCVSTDREAVEEYQAFRASQTSNDQDGPAKNKTTWVKGRSSIYVDAFNLALDTVLEDESLLFDAKELAVFEHWRQLEYESQYLLVGPPKEKKNEKGNCTPDRPLGVKRLIRSQICSSLPSQDICLAPTRSPVLQPRHLRPRECHRDVAASKKLALRERRRARKSDCRRGTSGFSTLRHLHFCRCLGRSYHHCGGSGLTTEPRRAEGLV